ncbi:MAG: DUF4091 domain-containing protein, partial [Marinilabiliales bacterium]|nr:DUF4091 domain-containing protein [Marinilabiliales bacterium]
TSIIPSRRWEASRDGAEDYHLLMMLKRKIAEYRLGDGAHQAMADQAEKEMNRIVQGITEKVKKIKEISREFIPYDIDFSLFVEGREKLIRMMEEMSR